MTRRTILVVLLLIGCLACRETDSPLPRGSDTHPAWSPDGGTIAFISNREGVRADRPINFEIYRASADGSDETRLTRNQEFEADADWSPDGARIAFKSTRDGNDEVYVIDADGENPRNLTRSDGSDGGPAWSPDGSQILFHSDRGEDGVPRFFVMNADGSNVRTLPRDPGPGYLGRWAPDGSEIVFNSDRDGNPEIYLMRADGSDVRRLTEDPAVNSYPRWSPDGKTIAYTTGSFETDRWDVYLMDRNAGNKRMIVEGTDSGNVAWSPDGRQILFGRYRRYGADGGEASELFVLDLATGLETRIPRGGAER